MELFALKNILITKNNTSLFSFKELIINKGDKVVIVGNSGSGKTTLLKLFNVMEKPEKGIILYKGENIFNKDIFSLRRNIIFIEQEPFVNGPTVRDFFYYIKNFSVYKNFSIDENEIKSLLKLFSLEYIMFDRRVETLSGGEKQRLALIRAILLKPEILLLDEPTSALDKNNTEIVINNILKSNMIETIISVSHNLLWIKNCNLEIEINKKELNIKNKEPRLLYERNN